MKIVILAGGSGTRLWPMSRTSMPKQLIKLFDGHSPLQKTILRFQKRYAVSDMMIVTSRELAPLVVHQVGEIDPHLTNRIAIEPKPANTAPAITFALQWLEEKNERHEQFLVAPSDHLITPEDTFLDKLEEAKKALQGRLAILFGVHPTHPHTGYGYIQCNPSASLSPITSFVEKPPKEIALALLQAGNSLWNAGIFLFDTAKFQKAISALYPDGMIPEGPIDKVLIEKTDQAAALPLHLSWSDIGTWDSLYEVQEKDENGCALKGDVCTHETKDSLIWAGRRLIATAHIENLLIVDTDDALFIGKRGTSESLRVLTDKLRERGGAHIDEGTLTYRPWGSYTVLEEGVGYKIKRISVTPGSRLSLQFHNHRSEHWVVIRGTATVTLGKEERTCSENESIFVPIEMHHRLENKTEEPLEIIEVQVGSYLGEDDIIRLDDIYGRKERDALPHTAAK